MDSARCRITPQGLEPQLTEPESVVLPITPRGTTEQRLLGSMAGNISTGFQVCEVFNALFPPAAADPPIVPARQRPDWQNRPKAVDVSHSCGLLCSDQVDSPAQIDPRAVSSYTDSVTVVQ